MENNNLIKIWSGNLSSLVLIQSEAVPYIRSVNTDTKTCGDQIISIKEESKPSLFLRISIKTDYVDQMMFAGHRSHRTYSSHFIHLSHYSLKIYSLSPSYKSQTTSSSTVVFRQSITTSKSICPRIKTKAGTFRAVGTVVVGRTAGTAAVANGIDTTDAKIKQVFT